MKKLLSIYPPQIIWALYREKMLAQGRYDAFLFVQECKGDVALIQEKLTEYEDMIAHPTGIWVQALALDTSVRLHKDGFVAGLRDALRILTQTEHDPQPVAQSKVSNDVDDDE